MKKQKLSKWEDKDMTKEIMNAVNTQIFGVWFLIGAALVFWMQAGFAMVEAGFTRAKNAGNIIMKNLMDFCIGTCVFILIGFSLLLGEDMIGLIGKPGILIFLHQTAESICHMHQIMIAIDMSVSIIDRFKEINIQDLNAKSRTIADRLCQCIFCITVPISTVGQSSQGIMVGLDHEFFILLCDLLLHMHDALVRPA